eukprot:6492699-Amphidinium_carterae.4
MLPNPLSIASQMIVSSTFAHIQVLRTLPSVVFAQGNPTAIICGLWDITGQILHGLGHLIPLLGGRKQWYNMFKLKWHLWKLGSIKRPDPYKDPKSCDLEVDGTYGPLQNV